MAYGTTGWKNANKLNWDNVSVEGRKAPPEGLYEGKVVKIEPKLAKSGASMLEVRVELIGASDQALRDEGVGTTVYDNWVFTEAGGFRIKNFALVAGIDLPDSDSYDDVIAFGEGAINRTLPVMIKHETYQGKLKGRIDYYGDEPPKDEQNGASKRGGSGRGKPAQQAARSGGRGR